MARIRVCDAAMQVLRETSNAAVMWGDTAMIYQIAERAGIKTDDSRPFQTEQRVLNALSRRPGDLIPKKTVTGNGRVVRIFRIPERISSDQTSQADPPRGSNKEP